MMVLASGTAYVSADYHQFYLDASAPTVWDGNMPNGLIVALDRGAVVGTGVASGQVRCDYAIYKCPPPTAPDSAWEDEAEITIKAGNEGLHLAGWGGLSWEPVDFAVKGAREYVVRCSARWRDAEWDRAVETAVEVYLIEVWPAPLGS